MTMVVDLPHAASSNFGTRACLRWFLALGIWAARLKMKMLAHADARKLKRPDAPDRLVVCGHPKRLTTACFLLVC
jgi:hypothetical protein